MTDVATNSVSYWVPIATAFGGYISAQISDWLRDRRTHEREREARNAIRQNTVLERRNEFQRQTLLDLQEWAMKLMQSVGSAHLFDMRRWAKDREWHVERYPDDTNSAIQTSNAQTAMLGVRVRNEDVKNLLWRLKHEADTITAAKTPKMAQTAIGEASTLFVLFNEKIGQVLIELDDISVELAGNRVS